MPSSICKLKNLRYLDLSKNEDLKILSCFITKLQTLKPSSCKKLEALPRDIRKMTNLRYLELDQCIGLTHMPSGMGQLTSIQTLTLFVVGNDHSPSKLCGGLWELKSLNNLRGELTTAKLENSKNAATETKEANLKEKQNLGVLRIEWTREVNDHKIFDEDMQSVVGNSPASSKS